MRDFRAFNQYSAVASVLNKIYQISIAAIFGTNWGSFSQYKTIMTYSDGMDAALFNRHQSAIVVVLTFNAEYGDRKRALF